MIDYTAAEIAEIVEGIVQEQRSAVGMVGTKRTVMSIEGSDGKWVVTNPLTEMEREAVTVALYGQERADAMAEGIKDSRAAGSVDHDLSGY